MRIGTRGSALALAQAHWVADRLPGSEVVTITTAGDRQRALGDKSRWVAELERALLEGEIDVAVHSAKDVPTELPEGLALVAIPPRADPRDALCGFGSLEAVPAGARVGTSSLRRAAQLRALREDLQVVEVRGNVDTRLRKLAEGQVDALVLALAGLERLGRASEVGAVLDGVVPAAGQGALAVEAVAGRVELRELDHPQSSACVHAERDLVRELGASCHTPVGAFARVVAGDEVELTGWVGLPDGSAWLTDRIVAASNEAGPACAERMLAAGAAELLATAEGAPAR